MRRNVKKLIAIILIFFIIGIKDVKAATATASFVASKETVKVGETFTITLKVSSEQGLNGILTEVEYDTEKLELTTATAGTNWSNLSSNTKLDLICNLNNLKADNVYNMTFKVKEGATGETEIKTGTINIDTMESGNNSMVALEPKTVKVTIGEEQEPQEIKILSKIEISKKPNKIEYNVGDKFDKNGMKIIAIYTDGSSKEVTNYTYNPSGNLKATDKRITISYTEGNITKTKTIEIKVNEIGNGSIGENGLNTGSEGNDSTVAKEGLLYTGLETILVPIIGLTILVIVEFVVYKKYNNI